MSHNQSPVKKALFVRLRAKAGKEAEVEAFLRDGLSAVMEEHETTTWYAVRFGHDDFAIRHVSRRCRTARAPRGQGRSRVDRQDASVAR